MTTVKNASKKQTINNNRPSAKIVANAIRFKVTTKLKDNSEVYEATANIPGFQPTKVVRTDGSTVFTTRSSLTKACRDRAAQYKRTPVFDYGTISTTTKAKIVQRVTGKVPAATAGACPVTGAVARS